MRVIAGKYGGRVFDSPRGHATHPMSDKVRGGLFNALGDISGLTVLDAFAGSGALGLEALSRGAERVVAVELDKSAQHTIERNAKALKLGPEYKLVRASAKGWLNTSSDSTHFDIVLCDPPYQDVQYSLLSSLSARVSPNGLLVVSWPGKQPAPVFEGFSMVRHKDYGDAQLIFYKHSSS